MDRTKVIYHELNEGKRPKRVSDICFRQLGGWQYDENARYVMCPLPQSVRYLSPIRGRLSERMVKAYISFLRETFDPKRFAARIKPHRKVEWTLDLKGMTRTQALTYLTAFRYVDEFPGIVREMVKRPKEPAEQAFGAFQAIHIERARQESNLWGHGLMASKERPVTIEQFRAKLTDPRVQSVQHHFIGPPPAPEKS